LTQLDLRSSYIFEGILYLASFSLEAILAMLCHPTLKGQPGVAA
jgi:hypothetical protein